MKEALDHLALSTEAAMTSKAAIAAGSATSVIFGFNADVVGIVAGILIGLAGLIYNIWATERRLKIMRDRRDDELP